MNVVNIATRLMRVDAYYVFGRFHIVRQCYSFIKKHFVKESCDTLLIPNKNTTLFPNICVKQSVKDLKKNAVALGFNLPKQFISEIHQFAIQEKCLRSGDRKAFTFSEVKNGQLSDGNAAVLGFIENPLRCGAVYRIITDQILLKVCATYLGYNPTHIEPRLFWSFVTEESDNMRREKWQTTGYHFDVDGFNFIYVNFYITPVTRYSGAHVMMKYSHHRKPLRMLFHSAYQTDEAILKHFGSENEIIIEGPEGFGFVQDSSCYHKALAPITDNRLMLQLRIK